MKIGNKSLKVLGIDLSMKTKQNIILYNNIYIYTLTAIEDLSFFHYKKHLLDVSVRYSIAIDDNFNSQCFYKISHLHCISFMRKEKI
jgi:hypothetical protein